MTNLESKWEELFGYKRIKTYFDDDIMILIRKLPDVPIEAIIVLTKESITNMGKIIQLIGEYSYNKWEETTGNLIFATRDSLEQIAIAEEKRRKEKLKDFVVIQKDI